MLRVSSFSVIINFVLSDTATVLHDSKQWYLLDDKIVTPVTPQQVHTV